MTTYGGLSTNKTPEATRADIREEFRKWGVEDFDILPNPRDGFEVATVVYWKNGRKQTHSCRRFDAYRTNLRAVYFLIEQMRLADQRGMLAEMAEAVAGLLGAPVGPRKRPWHEVLGVMPDADPDIVKSVYGALAKKRHPDAGGSEQAMVELNAAYKEFTTR